MNLTIISGGQTGIDQLGLEVAQELSIKTGGTAPKGYLTEKGADLRLRDVYGLKESTSSAYLERTKANIQDSDITLIFGDITSPGSSQTHTLCRMLRKPFLINPDYNTLLSRLQRLKPAVINIAGNRGSKLSPLSASMTRNLLRLALVEYIKLQS